MLSLAKRYRLRSHLSQAASLPLLIPLLIALLVVVPLARALTHARRRSSRRPRIFWGTFALLLLKYNSAASRVAGYESTVVILSAPPLSRRQDYDLTPGADLPGFVKPLVLRYLVLLWALLRFDIFQLYHTGRILHGTVLEFAELQLLRAAGKKTIVSCYGSDIWRPGLTKDPNRWDELALVPQYRYVRQRWYTDYIARNVSYCARHADWIVVSAPFHDYLERYDSVHHHVAMDLERWAYVGAEPEPGPVRIVHSSNHRRLKGTDELIAACERLRARGLDVELTLVEGMPNHVAREVYERADVMAVEFVMGTFGVFALESMALGKPVLAYIRPDVYELEPYLADCPIVNTSMDQIEQRLEELVRDPARRAALGHDGRAFVEAHHSYAAIGDFYDGIYRHLWSGDPQPTLPKPRGVRTSPATEGVLAC